MTVSKMTPQEIRTEWLKRLRSGEYEQTTGNLHLNGKFCCLGVLCTIGEEAGLLESKVEKPTTWRTGEDPVDRVIYKDINGDSGQWVHNILPNKFANYLGMDVGGRIAGEFTPISNHSSSPGWGPGIYSLYELNDTLKYSFEEIADVIENNSEKVFK